MFRSYWRTLACIGGQLITCRYLDDLGSRLVDLILVSSRSFVVFGGLRALRKRQIIRDTDQAPYRPNPVGLRHCDRCALGGNTVDGRTVRFSATTGSGLGVDWRLSGVPALAAVRVVVCLRGVRAVGVQSGRRDRRDWWCFGRDRRATVRQTSRRGSSSQSHRPRGRRQSAENRNSAVRPDRRVPWSAPVSVVRRTPSGRSEYGPPLSGRHRRSPASDGTAFGSSSFSSFRSRRSLLQHLGCGS